MGTPINVDKMNENLETVEVYVPKSKDVKVKWTRFTPLIVAILTMINMVFTSITGNSIFGISDEELASYVNLIISIVATAWTAYQNLPITKEGKRREEVGEQVIPRKHKAVKVVQNNDTQAKG